MAITRLTEPLTAAQLRAILDYNPKTGVLTWKYRPECPVFWNARWVGKPAGVIDHGYRIVTIDRRRYQASRLAWLFVYGEWPANLIDHINTNSLDNRIINLRDATCSQNGGNMRKPLRNTSGFKGVSWSKTRQNWVAMIAVRGVSYNLGHFSTAREASRAYRRAAKLFHGEFARG